MNQPWPVYIIFPLFVVSVVLGNTDAAILAQATIGAIYAQYIYDKVCCDKRESDE